MSRPSAVWNPARVAELCERYGSGETFDAIAESWGVTRGAIFGKWNRLRLPTKHWTAASDDRLADLAAEGRRFDDIADLMGVAAEAVAARFALIRRALGRQAI